jgi:hypothetical protein
MEIYTRALRCAIRPARTAFKVTPKQGSDSGGFAAVRKLHLVLFCTLLVGAGTVLRLLDLVGVGPLPDMPGIAAVIVSALGLFELRRLLSTIFSVGRRSQRRLVYRFEGDAEANCYSAEQHTPARLIDASAAGLGLVAAAALEIGDQPAVLLDLEDAGGKRHQVAAQVEVRSCREVENSFLVGATIVDIDPESRLRLMEWCYVVCSHERLRGRRPAATREQDAIIVAFDDVPDSPLPVRPSMPAMRQA